jgi:transcription antitermination factor NusG
MAEQPEIWKATPMADLFDKIQKLPDKTEGVPNFRRVPGYKVYCCGQPTVAGFENVLNKVCGDTYPKDGKIVWINMRQEPIVYVNGQPICARPPNKIGEYAELGNVTRDGIKVDEAEFVKVIEGKVKGNDGKLKYVDVNKKELEVEAKDVVSLHDVIEKVKEKFPGFTHNRIPVCNSAAPLEADFDTLCSALEGTLITTPVIVSDQVGLSRATTGCVAACLFREFQIAASFEGLVESVPGVNPSLLKMDRYAMDAKKDPLFRGEFEVIRELLAELADGAASKNQCDKIIDKNGPTKCGGTGIKQLRENIAESKLSYEIMDDAAQTFLKAKIMDNIHKYFYLICFSAYVREISISAKDAKYATIAQDLKIPKTFVAYMGEHSALRTIVDEGKGKLQWERPIPADELAALEALANADFNANLGTIIHDIYQSAHRLFKDLPQGDHKKRAKYRFASKIIMRILPANLLGKVEAAIAGGSISLDFYEILGLCSPLKV